MDSKDIPSEAEDLLALLAAEGRADGEEFEELCLRRPELADELRKLRGRLGTARDALARLGGPGEPDVGTEDGSSLTMTDPGQPPADADEATGQTAVEAD